MQIRESITKYYQGWTVCDDPTCHNRTRMMGVYGRRCLRAECKGRVTFEVLLHFFSTTNAMAHGAPKYTDTQLYNQLRFFVSLFDTQKALDSARPENRCTSNAYIISLTILTPFAADLVAIIAKNQVLLRTLGECVEKHLNNCGRRWIDLGTIFSSMKLWRYLFSFLLNAFFAMCFYVRFVSSIESCISNSAGTIAVNPSSKHRSGVYRPVLSELCYLRMLILSWLALKNPDKLSPNCQWSKAEKISESLCILQRFVLSLGLCGM